MLDLGWTELALVAIVALMVIGPKDLPKVLRTLGQWSRRLRGLAREFQGHIDDVIRDSELEDVRDSIKKTRRTNLGQTINKMVDPDGTVTRDLNNIGRESASRGRSAPRKDPLDYDGAGDPTGPAKPEQVPAPTNPEIKTKTGED